MPAPRACHHFSYYGVEALGRVGSIPETKPTTTDDIRNLLAHLLAGAAGEDEAHWLGLIGPVTALPIICAQVQLADRTER